MPGFTDRYYAYLQLHRGDLEKNCFLPILWPFLAQIFAEIPKSAKIWAKNGHKMAKNNFLQNPLCETL